MALWTPLWSFFWRVVLSIKLLFCLRCAGAAEHTALSVLHQEQNGLLLLFPRVHGNHVQSFGISLYLQIFLIHLLWLDRTYSWSWYKTHDIPVAVRPPISTDTFIKAKLGDFHHLLFFPLNKIFFKATPLPFWTKNSVARSLGRKNNPHKNMMAPFQKRWVY